MLDCLEVRNSSVKHYARQRTRTIICCCSVNGDAVASPPSLPRQYFKVDCPKVTACPVVIDIGRYMV